MWSIACMPVAVYQADLVIHELSKTMQDIVRQSVWRQTYRTYVILRQPITADCSVNFAIL